MAAQSWNDLCEQTIKDRSLFSTCSCGTEHKLTGSSVIERPQFVRSVTSPTVSATAIRSS